MTVKIPLEISDYFNFEDFEHYPLVKIPQVFTDYRGTILNLADGVLGDVAIISSKMNSMRANHVHSHDWHLSYIVSGRMTYLWKELDEPKGLHELVINQGEMIFTPPNTPHKMIFHNETIFIAISKMSRLTTEYEKDTIRLSEDFFNG